MGEVLGSVYVIGPAKGPHKIGRSKNPLQRLSSIQTTSAEPLGLLHERPSEQVYLLERCVHWLLRDKRQSGEWFSVTAQEAIEAVERANLLVEGGWRPEPRKRALPKPQSSRSYYAPTGNSRGRPPGREYPAEIKIRLTLAQLAALDRYAAALGLSRAEAARQAIDRMTRGE